MLRHKLGLVVAMLATVLLVSMPVGALSDEVATRWLATELLRLPRSLAPGETAEESEARVRAVAAALVTEARGFANGSGWTMTELAAIAGVIWHGETRFDRRVQSGEGHPVWHQDHGRARCGMQLHASGIVPAEVWEKLVGEGKEALHMCAQYGLRVVVSQAKQCGVFWNQRADRMRVAKMLAAYASGGKCVPMDRSWQRADLWVRVMATRPDHERRALPGYRRAAPKEIPPLILASARGIAAEIGKEPEIVPGFQRRERGPDGRMFVSLVEKHAEGKIGVSVFVQE